ncbi:carnosine synthase 1-like [Ruditapes philippinarum]|uniref:carnosine synthase 1-like n=1 Tax=Ruditapes philippinarum TaxID=129788 RepID=UPI00295BDCC1|nr:carnosine synthase 1-like [Ruditapes philippinarum]
MNKASLTEGITIDILSKTKREQKASVINTPNDVMIGKQVIVIGGGSYRSWSKWPEAASYGIKVILVDIEDNHPSRDIVCCYICYDFSHHTMDHAHACKIVQLIQDQGIVADGCLTFYDECTPLTALICDQLGLKGMSYKAAMIANSKTETHHILGLYVDKYQTKAFLQNLIISLKKKTASCCHKALSFLQY